MVPQVARVQPPVPMVVAFSEADAKPMNTRRRANVVEGMVNEYGRTGTDRYLGVAGAEDNVQEVGEGPNLAVPLACREHNIYINTALAHIKYRVCSTGYGPVSYLHFASLRFTSLS